MRFAGGGEGDPATAATGAAVGAVAGSRDDAIETAGVPSRRTGTSRSDSLVPSLIRSACTPIGTSFFSPGRNGSPSSSRLMPKSASTITCPLQPAGTITLQPSASVHAVASAGSEETPVRCASCTTFREATSTSLTRTVPASHEATAT